MILYHFPTSPYARRVRLALAHKGLRAELRDARASAEHAAEVRRIHPLATVPVLVDGERIVVDSMAIVQYLDAIQPAPPLWPEGIARAEAVEILEVLDRGLGILTDIGMRYSPVNEQARAEHVGRSQRALEWVAAKADREFLAGDRWSVADMGVVASVLWLEGLPARAAAFPPAKQVVDLGWTIPPALVRWVDRHRTRADVTSL